MGEIEALLGGVGGERVGTGGGHTVGRLPTLFEVGIFLHCNCSIRLSKHFELQILKVRFLRLR